MRNHVTVIPGDFFIAVDGVSLVFPFAASDALHALQWHNGSGHIEYADGRANRPLGPEEYEREVEPFVALWKEEKNKPVPAPSFAEARAAKYAEIIGGADQMKRLLSSRYSAIEEDTWPEQEAGARRITGTENDVKDGTARLLLADPVSAALAARLVERLAEIDGASPEAFAGRVISNADAAFELGRRTLDEQRAFESSLRKASDIKEIQAIAVRYSALAGEAK